MSEGYKIFSAKDGRAEYFINDKIDIFDELIEITFLCMFVIWKSYHNKIMRFNLFKLSELIFEINKLYIILLNINKF